MTSKLFPYSPAPESRAIVNIASSYGLFIGGEFVEPEDGETFKTINPASEEVLAEISEAGARDIDRAVAAARKAFDGVWGSMSGKERAKYLFRIARIIQERSRELAVLESLDNGKPIKESRDVDLPLVAAHFFYYAGWADKLEHAGFGANPKPIGVAAQVIPWNFPLMMLAWKIAPALACGNTVVLKPAETTPLTALVFAEICQQAGLPAGVVNIVTGAGDTGQAAGRPRRRRQGRLHRLDRGRPRDREDPRRHEKNGSPSSSAARPPTSCSTTPRSTRPSKASSAASSSTRVTCVAPARGCSCRSRSPTKYSTGLRRRMSTLRLGDPLDKNTDVGAINSAEQLARIRELSDIGEAEGAERWSPPCELPDRGFWFPPTIFTGVTQAHRIAREEIFGPVLSVLTFRTPDEAIEKANNTPYGLSAGIWTDKGSRDPLDGRPAARRRRVGQHVQQVRPDLARSAATRSPATAARAAATGWRPTSRRE